MKLTIEIPDNMTAEEASSANSVLCLMHNLLASTRDAQLLEGLITKAYEAWPGSEMHNDCDWNVYAFIRAMELGHNLMLPASVALGEMEEEAAKKHRPWRTSRLSSSSSRVRNFSIDLSTGKSRLLSDHPIVSVANRQTGVPQPGGQEHRCRKAPADGACIAPCRKDGDDQTEPRGH